MNVRHYPREQDTKKMRMNVKPDRNISKLFGFSSDEVTVARALHGFDTQDGIDDIVRQKADKDEIRLILQPIVLEQKPFRVRPKAPNTRFDDFYPSQECETFREVWQSDAQRPGILRYYGGIRNGILRNRSR